MKKTITIDNIDYTIYDDGKVVNQKGKILKHHNKNRLYIVLGFSKSTQYLHRLLAKAFILNPHYKSQVNHINGNKKDNRLSNLEWVTAKENLQHAVDIGLRRKPKNCKLTGKFIYN